MLAPHWQPEIMEGAPETFFLFAMTGMLCFGYSCTKLTLAHLIHTPYRHMFKTHIPFFLVTVNAFIHSQMDHGALGRVTSTVTGALSSTGAAGAAGNGANGWVLQAIPALWSVRIAFVVTLVAYIWSVRTVATQMCEVLGIKVFTLTRTK